MKKCIIFSLCLLSVFTGFAIKKPAKKVANTVIGFTVKGTIKGLKDGIVYLQPYSGNWKDSADIINGQFLIKGFVPSPIRCSLISKDYSLETTVFIENNVITVTGILGGDYRVRGSNTHNEYDAYMTSLSTYDIQMMRLNNQLDIAKLKRDTNLIKSIGEQWNMVSKNKKASITNYICKHPDSYVSADLLFPLTSQQEYGQKELYKMYDGLTTKIKRSTMGKYIEISIGNRFPLLINRKAPDFALNDINGKKVSLSGYRGKYILLDFWASWCGPCRGENPNVLKAYNKYHSKGLEILAVSLDNARQAWVKAIAEDKLPWTQVSDLKGWKSDVAQLYRVGGIPMNFLINPQGIIIDGNLRGSELETKLAEIFK
jgi:peroxiredoxin